MKRLAGFCALAVVLHAVPGGATGWQAHLSSGEPARIDLDLVDAKPAEVFPVFARVLEAELDLDPLVDRLVTVRLKNVRVESALGVVCESIGCLVGFAPGPPARLRIARDEKAAQMTSPPPSSSSERSLEQPITLSLADASIVDVLTTFGRILGAEVDLPPGLSGLVTLEMKNAPAGDALEQICSANGLVWRVLEVDARRRLEIRRAAS